MVELTWNDPFPIAVTMTLCRYSVEDCSQYDFARVAGQTDRSVNAALPQVTLFGSGPITDIVQDECYSAVYSTYLHILAYTSTTQSPPAVSSAAGMLSVPGKFPFCFAVF